MQILGIEKVSLVDWQEKICATIFTGGCDFRCPFCHNADIVKGEYEPLSESDVFDYLNERKKLLDGVTISGGEPTLQSDLLDFIKRVKNLGLGVKLDTNGSRPEVLDELLKTGLIDYVAMDIKNNFDDYADICGVRQNPADKVKKSLEILHNSGVSYELRTTLVKPFHVEQNIRKLADDLAGENVLFLQKFVDSGNLIDGESLAPVNIDEAENFQKILSRTIKDVQLRGY